MLTIFIFVCCGSYNYVDTSKYGQSMEQSYNKMFSIEQFDSICKADNISYNLDDWEKMPIQDDETEAYEYMYMYIKSIDNTQCIYRLEKTSYKDSVRITKRTTK